MTVISCDMWHVTSVILMPRSETSRRQLENVLTTCLTDGWEMILTLFQAKHWSWALQVVTWWHKARTHTHKHVMSLYQHVDVNTQFTKKFTWVLHSITQILTTSMFVINQIHCSGPKDSRFNEHLLLAELKMFGRESERAVKWVRDREDSLSTDNTSHIQNGVNISVP